MSRIDILRAELTDDPLTRGYSAMSDAAAAIDLNIMYRTRNLDTLTGSEVLNAIDKTEFNAKTDAEKQQVWDILHLGTINPFGLEAALFTDIFGGGSVTIAALQAIRKEDVSRGEEIGWGFVGHSDVEDARRV